MSMVTRVAKMRLIFHANMLDVSEKKARSNLVYQFKKKTNRIPSTRITLPGKVVTVN